jgi:hypothetical protein
MPRLGDYDTPGSLKNSPIVFCRELKVGSPICLFARTIPDRRGQGCFDKLSLAFYEHAIFIR